MIVAHHDIKTSAGDLVQLYRAEDQVEKDFQTIKSAIHLRPVRHRLDDKVRAHITLCVLALLLERTIEKRLRDAGQPCSAPTTFETLRTAHLNLLDLADGPGAYDLTLANPHQTAIIEALGLSPLLDTVTSPPRPGPCRKWTCERVPPHGGARCPVFPVEFATSRMPGCCLIA